MAEVYSFTAEQEADWNEWLATRPDCIQELGRRFPPNRLYRLWGDGHRVTVHGYNEDGTMSVIVSGDYNLVAFARKVFGVKPEDLEECDLPGESDPVGEILTKPEEIDAFIDAYKNANSP